MVTGEDSISSLSQECPELASYSLPLKDRSPSNFAKGLFKYKRGIGSCKEAATDVDAYEDLVAQLVRKCGSFDED